MGVLVSRIGFGGLLEYSRYKNKKILKRLDIGALVLL